MVCPNCGNQINTVSNSCPFCNTPLQYEQEVTYQQYEQQQYEQQQYKQQMYDQSIYQQPMPNYVNQVPTQVIKPQKSVDVAGIIFKIIGSLISLAILVVVILFLTTRHLYCTRGKNKVLVLYTNSKLVHCISIPKEICDGFNSVKDQANESNVNTIVDSLKDYYVKEGSTCKLR